MCVCSADTQRQMRRLRRGRPKRSSRGRHFPLRPTEHSIEPNAVSAAEAQLLPARLQQYAEKVLDSLCDPSRLKIVQALRAATSQHLRVLRTVDAVHPERRGQYVLYSLSGHVNADVLEGVANAFDQLRPTGS